MLADRCGCKLVFSAGCRVGSEDECFDCEEVWVNFRGGFCA